MLSCLGCRQPHKFDFFVFPVVRLLFQSFSKTSIFQVMLSIFMGPSSLYLSLDYWVYPLRDYIGDTGCYMFIYCRNIELFNMQLQSFFVTTFRYVCLFHEKFLLKFNLSPDVSRVHDVKVLKFTHSIFWKSFLLLAGFSVLRRASNWEKIFSKNITIILT